MAILVAVSVAAEPRQRIFHLYPRSSANSIFAVDLDVAGLLQTDGTPFDQCSLVVRAVNNKLASSRLPFRFEPAPVTNVAQRCMRGRLVFLVPDAQTSSVVVSAQKSAGGLETLDSFSSVGDGDVLRLSNAKKTQLWLRTLAPTVIDLDGDGRRDLIGSGRYGEGAPLVWLRNVGRDTNPTFSEREVYELHTANGERLGNERGAWHVSASVVDWDGDALPDLVLGCDPRVMFHRNVGTRKQPRWASGQEIYRSPIHNIHTLAADWDGDQLPDLLVSQSYPAFRLVWLRSKARGAHGLPRLAEPVVLTAGGRPIELIYAAPAVGDWDGDGDLDLLCGQYYGVPDAPGPTNPRGDVWGVYFFENVGNRSHPRLAPGKQLRDAQGETISGPFYPQPTLVDWNLDGQLDLIVSSTGGTALYLNVGSRSDPQLQRTAIPFHSRPPVAVSDFAAPVIVDLDNDKKSDLVVADGDGRVLFFRGDTPLAFSLPTALRSQGRPIDEYGESDEGERHRGYVKVVFADWNGDAQRDMIMWTMNSEQGWLHGWNANSFSLKFFPGTSGPLNFGQPQQIRAAGKQIVAGWRCKPDVVDLDGDGLLDLIQITGTGKHEQDDFEIALFKNVGTRAQFELAAPAPLLLTTGKPLLTDKHAGRRMALRLVDWDGDGDLDLFTGRDTQFFNMPGVWYWENEGSRTRAQFAPPKVLGHINDRVHSWHEVVPEVVDLDGDGRLDLLVGNGDSGYIHFFRRGFVERGYLTATPAN